MFKQFKSAQKEISGPVISKVMIMRCGRTPVVNWMGQSDLSMAVAIQLPDDAVAVPRTLDTKDGWRKHRGPKQSRTEEKEEWPQRAWKTVNTMTPVRHIHRCRSTFSQRDSLCQTYSLSQHYSFQGKFHCSSLISYQPGSMPCC